MIRSFREMPLKRKLMFIVMAASSIVAAVAFLAFAVSEALSYRRSLYKELSVLGEILGTNTAAAVAFHDPKAAGEILAALRAHPHIVAAYILSNEGRVFARYVTEEAGPDMRKVEVGADSGNPRKTEEALARLRQEMDWFYNWDFDLEVILPIVQDGQRISTMVIQSNMKEIRTRLAGFLAAAGIFLIGSLAAVYLVFSRLQGVITEPILRLAQTMRKVSREKDYSVCMVRESGGEIGELIDGFNEMLEQIHLRDEKLARYSEELEEKVVLRTAELKESEERTRIVLTTAVDGILTVDLDGAIDTFNPAAERIFGYASDEVIGKNAAMLAPDSFRDRFKEFIEVYLKVEAPDGSGYRIEGVGLRKDGRKIPLEMALNVFSIHGRRRITCILRDITERREFEDQLRSAKEAAESASVAKSQFLATMSHEIRTPMNGVLGMTDLLLQTGLTGEQRRFAEIAKRSGEALLNLINDILDFSRIEAGKLELEAIDFDLHRTVEDAVELIGERAQRKGLELACLIDSETPSALRGDPGRLRQVLLNLLGNAVKFTERGEVVVRVAPSPEDDGKRSDLLRFEVSDTGVGIRPHARKKIFESFVQADGSTTRQFGGTGLGLAICRQLVLAMGGEIGVESEEGKGSTFWFTARFGRASGKPLVRPVPRFDLKTIRILIVDDNATNRSVLSRQITNWGIRNEAVEGGSEALAALRDAKARGMPFDLAILDMQMPVMDGLQLARAIAADPETRGVRLIMLSSMGLRGDAREARHAGIQGYLSKPVLPSVLFDCIAAVMCLERDDPGSAQLVTQYVLPDGRRKFSGRILLAEDNPVNQEVAVSMLRTLGCTVDVAEDGRKAVAAVGLGGYDLVLMDCQMPEMDGYEATRTIRAAESSRIPIVALTANAMEGDRDRCLAAGMDDHLAKPFMISQMGEMLARWLPGRTRPEEPPVAASSPIDRASLDNIRALQQEGGPDLVAKVVGIYLESSGKQIDTLRNGLKNADAEAVQRAAHSLKSSSANVGATRLSGLLKDLESMARAKDLEMAGEALAEIETEYEAATAVLSRLKVESER